MGRGRCLIGAVAFVLLGCGRPPFAHCGAAVQIIDKTFFDGTWAHTVHLESRRGPMLDVPTDVELGDASFVLGEEWLYGIEGLQVTILFRVSSHLRVEEGGSCGYTIAENDGRPWTEYRFVRVDWSTELTGSALSGILTDGEIEPTIILLSGEEEDYVPNHFEEGVGGAPTLFEITNDYLVRPDDCADALCESLVRARHQFVRR